MKKVLEGVTVVADAKDPWCHIDSDHVTAVVYQTDDEEEQKSIKFAETVPLLTPAGSKCGEVSKFQWIEGKLTAEIEIDGAAYPELQRGVDAGYLTDLDPKWKTKKKK